MVYIDSGLKTRHKNYVSRVYYYYGHCHEFLHINILLYLRSPTLSLDEPIFDRRGSYTHE